MSGPLHINGWCQKLSELKTRLHTNRRPQNSRRKVCLDSIQSFFESKWGNWKKRHQSKFVTWNFQIFFWNCKDAYSVSAEFVLRRFIVKQQMKLSHNWMNGKVDLTAHLSWFYYMRQNEQITVLLRYYGTYQESNVTEIKNKLKVSEW